MGINYKNGSTPENVYADVNCEEKIGSLNPHETCECILVMADKDNKKKALVIYNKGTNNQKVGFVKYLGGVQI